MNTNRLAGGLLLMSTLLAATAAEPRIEIDATRVIGRVSPYLTGACIEDVNHEVYGGIDSQMIFGESFAEPAPQPPLKGFKAYGGSWRPEAGILVAEGGSGPKLIANLPPFETGVVSVELRFGEDGPGNAGLIVKVSEPGNGADAFNGYEIAIEPSGTLVLGKHRQNWEPIRRVPCPVKTNEWLKLAVGMTATTIEVKVNGQTLLNYEDAQHPLRSGRAGLRTWQRNADFRNLVVTTGGASTPIPFHLETARWQDGVSGMWRGLRTGTAAGNFAIYREDPFSGTQAQQITMTGGDGGFGIENQGLNRWGMNFVRGKPYDGYLYVLSPSRTELYVALENKDGTQLYAERRLTTAGRGWERLNFKLTPGASDKAGRFAIKLRNPGTVTVGYAFLQPGSWGRYKGLPVRKDVALGLIGQGITVLRQGGCMINADEYRWKKMIGPRAERPPYKGWWYPYSSNGWGIFDFLNFCEAAGFLAIPDVNCNETAEDMADFVEYVNGPAESTWGAKRAADGHPKPYGLKYLQIGNEERVDELYFQKFKAIAEAVWARDPEIILVVGDFAYNENIADPFKFAGSPVGLTTLAAHQKILRLAREHNREVWFDVHVWTDGPRPNFAGTFSYIDALAKLAEGARHKVVIFEFNAGNHSQRRALANAGAIIAVEQDGRIPIATSANCLQPDGQNDNGWDQGLLFLNPWQVWLQPPGWVARMISRNYQPLQLRTAVRDGNDRLVASAKSSENGKTIVLQVVNYADNPVTATLALTGFMPSQKPARVEVLSAPLSAANTASNPHQVKPEATEWDHQLLSGRSSYTFLPHSFTTLRLRGERTPAKLAGQR